MLRKFLILACALALVAPVWAFDVTHTGLAPGTITINLEIPEAAVVEWQDITINFSSSTYPTGDFYRLMTGGVRGLYDPLGPGPYTWPNTRDKASTDPFANGYYESRDGACIWYQGNADVDMTVHPDGDLSNGETELDTWYTMAGCGYTGGFYFDNVFITSGNIPNDGQGVYAYPDDGTGFLWSSNSTYHYPAQWPFPMDEEGRMITLPGVTSGNIKWLARVKRTSDWPDVIDQSGSYSTTISVTFVDTP